MRGGTTEQRRQDDRDRLKDFECEVVNYMVRPAVSLHQPPAIHPRCLPPRVCRSSASAAPRPQVRWLQLLRATTVPARVLEEKDALDALNPLSPTALTV